MKRVFIVALLLGVLISSCTNVKKENEEKSPEPEETGVVKISDEDMKSKTFEELFKSIEPSAIPESVFKLVGTDFTVITAGPETSFNSMTASYGGWGQLFDKPVTWCFLRANRYTLELIKKEKTYTMTYFEDQYKDQVLFLGSKSGRDSDKMKELSLTHVTTPAGNVTYKEAKLIIECKLMEVTTVNPDDFYNPENKAFVTEGYEEAKDYHKLVFGEITQVWIKQQ